MRLTIKSLCKEACGFSEAETGHREPSLYGKNDGKAVGTYLEQKFRRYLADKGYLFEDGNSAIGIDFPDLKVDIKVTSIVQPQSSCPYKSARQKIFGLGYSLIVFVYEKHDDAKTRTATLRIAHTIFVEAANTADFQTTKGLRDILANEGNADDLVAFMTERHLPADEIELRGIADALLRKKPDQGYLTISNALQWRLQYGRAIEKAGSVKGVQVVFRGNGA